MRGECLALTKGEQRWDYLFVQDAVEAIYRTLTNPTAAGVINLGSGQAYTIKSIAESIRDMIDPGLPLGFGQIPYRPDQIMLLEADIAKLRNLADWVPQTGLTEGLRRTLDWHLQRKGIIRG
jgi:nucleoside-diphosphate-sugar epimerase